MENPKMSDRTENSTSMSATVSTRAPLKYRGLVQRLGPILRSNDEFARALSRAVEIVDTALIPHPVPFHALAQKIERLEGLVRKLLQRPMPSSSVDMVDDGPLPTAFTGPGTESVHDVQSVIQKKAAQPDNTGGKSLGAPRQLADILVQLFVRGDDGEYRVMTRSEIEHILIRILKISRNSAQSAATKAVHIHDPENPKRLSRKSPVARRVSPTLQKEFARLHSQKMTLEQIARETGAVRETVSRHLKSRDI